MALITCPECSRPNVSDQAPTCPGCGCPISATLQGEPAAAANIGNTAVTLDADVQLRLQEWQVGFSDRHFELVIANCGLPRLHDAVNLVGDFPWKKIMVAADECRDNHIEALSTLPHVETFEISGCPRCTDVTLLCLSRMPNLRTIDLSCWMPKRDVSVAGFRQLTRLPRIELIKLPFSVDRSTLSHLKQALPNTVILQA